MTSRRPNANEMLEGIVERMDGRPPLLFLDFDGTLAPIVERPDQAELSESMRQTLRALADRCPVAIVSGRDLPDVRRRVGLEGIAYAGSHGFEIRRADGERFTPTRADDFLEALGQAEAMLRGQTAGIPGVEIERKRYSVAAHYRRVPTPEQVERVEQQVERARRSADGLRLTHGKKVFELQPDLDWHKGHAIRALIEALDIDPASVLPVYLGDDVTDEDAFRALAGEGVTVVVDPPDGPTAADYALDGPDEVERFLRRLSEYLDPPRAARNDSAHW